MTDDPDACPTCGATLDVERTGGVCAACLLLGAADDSGDGAVIGKLAGYDLIEVIARGGMGIVYRARQSEPAREVALKALPGAAGMSPEARQRFRIEAQAMARLEHPAILPIYELGEADETLFFTMKFAAGGSLAQRIGGYAGKWREIAELIANLAEAVQFAHERGVLHRDLKPGNILFDDGGQAFVSDFGLAKMLGDDTHLTRTIALMGTPNYMAPEVAARNGSVTVGSDVWSLGVMLYELLAGQPPFSGDSIAAVLRAVAEDEPPPLQGGASFQLARNSDPAGNTGKQDACPTFRVPRDLAVITRKALEKMPAHRYSSARDLADDLRRWLKGDPILARPTPALERALLWARRYPALTGMAAVLFVVLAVASVLLLRANRDLQTAVTTTRSQRDIAESSLRDSLIAQSSLLRQSEQTGQRFKALELIRQAIAASGPGIELRHEAAAALVEPDVECMGEAFRFKPVGRAMDAVAITSDFRCCLTTLAEDGTVALREIASGKVLWRYKNTRTTKPDQFAVSDSAQFAALVHPDLWLEVWDTKKNELRLSTQLVPAAKQDRSRVPCRPFRLHPTLPQILWVDEAGSVQMQNLDTGDVMPLLHDQTRSTALALVMAGTHFYIATGKTVELWQISPLQRIWQVPLLGTGGYLGGLGLTLVASDRATREAMVIQNGKILARFLGDGGDTGTSAFFKGSHLALSLEARGVLCFWDTRDAYCAWRMDSRTGFVAANHMGNEFLIEQIAGQATRWKRAPDRVFRELYSPQNHVAYATSPYFALSADGRFVSTFSTTTAILWDTRTGGRVSSWVLPRAPKFGIYGGFSKDGRAWLASRVSGDGIYRRSLTDGPAGVQVGEPERIPGTEDASLGPPLGDGETWLIYRGKSYTLWKPDTAPVPVVAGTIRSGDTIGAEGHLVVRSNYPPGTHPVRELNSEKTVGTFTSTSTGSASLTADGRWLVLSEAAQYRFIETATWQQRAAVPCRLDGSREALAVVSAGGALAAVRQEQDVIDLISLPTGRLLVKLTPPQPIGVRAIEFSANGDRLHVLGNRHRLYQWDLKALLEELEKLGLAW